MTSKFSLGMLERIEAEESADVRRLRRLPVTVPKMRVIILSRPFLFLGIEKAELLFEAPPQSVKKVEVQEALPPAGVIGAEPLTLVPQHFLRKPA